MTEDKRLVHKFWIDGTLVYSKNYHELSSQIIDMHMISEGLNFWSDKKQYIQNWFDYYKKNGLLSETFYEDIAFDLWKGVNVRVDKQDKEVGSKNQKFITFIISKTLENFNPDFYWELNKQDYD